jgi:hypothetical protein
MDKDQFAIYIHQAMDDHKSGAYSKFYNFLVDCFTRADVKMEGKVTEEMIDSLIEDATALERKLGFVPSEEYRKASRAKLSGQITLCEWINWAVPHIGEKSAAMSKDFLSGKDETETKEEFISFIKKATDKNSHEYRQLYFFLLSCFQEGDVKKQGAVDPVAFDKMIEAAAAAPRKYGLAPKTSDMFKNNTSRLAKRWEYFKTMDTDGNGLISFHEWLVYAHKHIIAKVSSIH